MTGQSGTITYHFAKSPKGGSAEVFLDGTSKGLVSFSGTQGSTRSPEFNHNISFDGLTSGAHTLELRSINGTVYVDKFTLKSASRGEKAFSGPGQTSSSTGTVSLGGELLDSLNVEQGTSALAVMAEADAPIRLLLIDPSGSIIDAVEASGGVAVIERPVTQTGTYMIKVVNLSVGPVQVFTAATPLVAR